MGKYINDTWFWNKTPTTKPSSIYKNNFITKLNNFLGINKTYGIADALNAEYGLDLTDEQWQDLLVNNYGTEDYGFLDTKHWDIDYDLFEKDLAQYREGLSKRPDDFVDPATYIADARARAERETQEALNELAALHTSQVSNFNDELSSLASSYNASRNAILSNQYQQNAQLMDTMTSQLDKQNRNALEAGASAGMRLAGNINTLLSTQNKQSQTSLETANQLAQMMVNQRNAEASVRGRYGEYMNQHFATKQDIKNQEYNKFKDYYSTEYDLAKTANDKAVNDWTNTYASNPLYEFKNSYKNKSSEPTSKYGS